MSVADLQVAFTGDTADLNAAFEKGCMDLKPTMSGVAFAGGLEAVTKLMANLDLMRKGPPGSADDCEFCHPELAGKE